MKLWSWYLIKSGSHLDPFDNVLRNFGDCHQVGMGIEEYLRRFLPLLGLIALEETEKVVGLSISAVMTHASWAGGA